MLKQATLLSVLMTVGFASYSDSLVNQLSRDLMAHEGDNFRQLHDGHRDLQTTPTRVTTLSTDIDAPQITNMTQWITQIKANAIIGALPFNDLIIPGANHAGLNYVQVNQTLLKTQLTAMGFNTTEQSNFGKMYQNLVQDVLVGQLTTIPQLLRLGARYLDLRVTANHTNSSKIFLSNSHASQIPLERVLIDINDFITNNTGEILLVDIRNDDSEFGVSGNAVDMTKVAALVNKFVNSAYILPQTKLADPINSYGGVFFSGFDFNTSFTGVVIQHSESAVKADSPVQVVKNLEAFYATTGGYTTQTPTTYDFMAAEPFITATWATIAASIRNETDLVKQIQDSKKPQGNGKQKETKDQENKRNKLRERLEKHYSQLRDILVSDQHVPAYRLGSAQLSNILFLDMISRITDVQSQINIVSIDDFNIRNALEIVQFNLLRFI